MISIFGRSLCQRGYFMLLNIKSLVSGTLYRLQDLFDSIFDTVNRIVDCWQYFWEEACKLSICILIYTIVIDEAYLYIFFCTFYTYTLFYNKINKIKLCEQFIKRYVNHCHYHCCQNMHPVKTDHYCSSAYAYFQMYFYLDFYFLP